jgi:acyl-[acyl-carrier-protein] desaturase
VGPAEEVVRAIADDVIGFEMPGAIIARFGPASARIADAGIYDPRNHLDDNAAPRRDDLAAFLDQRETAAVRFTENRQARAARRARHATTV